MSYSQSTCCYPKRMKFYKLEDLILNSRYAFLAECFFFYKFRTLSFELAQFCECEQFLFYLLATVYQAVALDNPPPKKPEEGSGRSSLTVRYAKRSKQGQAAQVENRSCCGFLGLTSIQDSSSNNLMIPIYTPDREKCYNSITTQRDRGSNN